MKAHGKFMGQESRVSGRVSLGMSFGLLESPGPPGLSGGSDPCLLYLQTLLQISHQTVSAR